MTVFPALRRKRVESLEISAQCILDGAASVAGSSMGGFRKLLSLRALAAAFLIAAPVFFSCAAQTPAQNAKPVPPPAAPAAAVSPQVSSEPSSANSKVIFSRSSDDNGNTTTAVGPAAQPAPNAAAEPTATDAERLAVTFTALDLEVHLQSAAHRIAVRARVTVRNDGKVPLTQIPLQISSSLNWEQIRVDGRDAAFPVATLNSDTDHTGQLHEAAVPLAAPLAPGQTLTLDTVYSGTIVPSAQRLLMLGTPEAIALHSDWDEISAEFTGLRGFGNVVWYPVSTVPAILGDGARLFDEIGRHKLSLAHVRFRLFLTVEFPHGDPPTVALVNGSPVPLTIADAPGLDADLSGIATASFQTPALGFLAPSLFVAVRKAHPAANLIAYTTPDNDISVQTWLTEDAAVTPFVQNWLGSQPHSSLSLLDLPDPEDAPYETGTLLATSLAVGPADRLDDVLVHSLAHAYLASPFEPPPAWLNEGVATFLESVWVEKQHGRDRALQMLESDRTALALIEPPSPGTSAGEPLAVATAPVYYRTKAAYVLWMLRDLTSDQALGSALRGLIAEEEAGKSSSATPAGSLQALLKQAGVSRDLSWFFSDWVDADRGLPDLTINSVFPNAAQAGTYLVAVNVTNAGYAAANVPVTVRTAKSTLTERVFIPSHGTVVERLVVMGPPTQVQVNDGTVPETTASFHVTDVHVQSPDQPDSNQLAPRNSSSSVDTPAAPQ